ncbi:MAG: hypothetical protein WC777_02440 [Candidatus Gracilibacteria bacterium]|jgi:hypothetical protein
MPTAVAQRKRVNFMLDVSVLEQLEALVPSGDRSSLVNTLLEEKMIDLSREKAFELIDTFKKTHRHKKMTDEELLKSIHEARKDLL